MRKIADLDEDIASLLALAREAAQKAHAPYSGFHVGAALLADDGVSAADVITGCNVENASYGLTICAERNVATTAIARGLTRFVRMAIHAPTDTPSVPCGACRQFMAEFEPDLELWIGCDSDAVRRTTLRELFPDPFLGGALESGES